MATQYFKCRLKTGGKTIAELKEKFKGQAMTDTELEHIQKAYEYFNGVELLLSLWDWDNKSSYHVSGWNNDQDENIMNGIYNMELTWADYEYAEFVEVWKAGEYEPDGVLTFDKEFVEVIEEIFPEPC